jgi:hypothetical protein
MDRGAGLVVGVEVYGIDKRKGEIEREPESLRKKT